MLHFRPNALTGRRKISQKEKNCVGKAPLVNYRLKIKAPPPFTETGLHNAAEGVILIRLKLFIYLLFCRIGSQDINTWSDE